ncbi:MAG: L,D-transpeptidase [Actinomycetota bacterium]|nr:L,D-transpeptidase [Actinomycetota bacterium]
MGTGWGRGRTVLAVAALGLIAVAVVVVAVVLRAGGDDGTDVAAAVSTTSTTAAPTTTTIVVERTTLPAGVSEYATVDPTVDDVSVRNTAPPGWDETLTPVVTSSDPEPPRSGLDLARVAMPSEAAPISGRHVSEGGWTFANPTTFAPPQPLVFGVVQRQGDWIQVLVPVRPNGTVGWLSAADATVTRTDLSVVVSLTERRVRVLRGAVEEFAAPISIGRPSTPTPTGEFYVTDVVPSVNPAGGYGPVALALNGYSEVMDAFGGESDAGPSGQGAPDAIAPVLALHGTNRPSSVGRAQSNGCPRLYNDDMLRLAELVPTGTPVRIWP